MLFLCVTAALKHQQKVLEACRILSYFITKVFYACIYWCPVKMKFIILSIFSGCLLAIIAPSADGFKLEMSPELKNKLSIWMQNRWRRDLNSLSVERTAESTQLVRPEDIRNNLLPHSSTDISIRTKRSEQSMNQAKRPGCAQDKCTVHELAQFLHQLKNYRKPVPLTTNYFITKVFYACIYWCPVKMKFIIPSFLSGCLLAIIAQSVDGFKLEMSPELKKRLSIWMQNRWRRDLNSLSVERTAESTQLVRPEDIRNNLLPHSSTDISIRTKRSKKSVNQAKRPGCALGTCTVHDLAHRIHQLTNTRKIGSAPMDKISPQGYGRRRRSLPERRVALQLEGGRLRVHKLEALLRRT
ncbi:hypothetical protein DPEC_G00347090 [Dallia pectoralis]|uniref:Uncharacterized protein n=1 Tax=Dallia pectoralis TaxID=75939 RepID=A0ACC2F3W7_DALPE|nr:hypothetical protein DPEC_G00347090 [Dallia pectoralis]